MTFDTAAVRRKLLKIVASPRYTPQKPRKLLDPLGLTLDEAPALRKLIREMIVRGELAYGKNHLIQAGATAESTAAGPGRERRSPEPKAGKPSQKSGAAVSGSATGLITGRFQRRPSGIGFVRPRYAVGEDAPMYDIFIPAHWTRDAASGDTVAVEIMDRKPRDDYGGSTRRSSRSNNRYRNREEEERGPRGRVVDILQRASNRFVGSYVVEDDWGYVRVDGSIFKRNVPIGDAAASSAQPGDKIVVEMIKFPTPYNDGEAVIVEVLGAHGVPGLDTLLILRQFELPDHFSEAALAAARKEVDRFFDRFPDDTGQSLVGRHTATESLDAAGRVDLTRELVITIDPADAKDFDDAVSLERLADGGWRLGVHIADVSHFVSKTSPINREASDRATSVYLPDRVIPMLPEVLSNALASLQPKRIRLTKSVFMEFTAEGVRTHTEIVRSAVRSDRRFSYVEVQNFYDRPKHFDDVWQPEHRELLNNLRELMRVLRRRRFERGALEMDLPETKIDLDGDGAVIGAHVAPHYDSHRVIEECMLAANEAVADFLAARDIPFLRRIHSGPSIRKLRGFADFIQALGVARLDADDLYKDRFALQRLLDAVRGSSQEYAVNFSLLRSMQKAVYSPEPEGHYALASSCYCHFTSPIRRYPDLLIHRLLDEILDGKTPKPELRELVLLGEHCSEREQRAEEAERELVKLKLIDYMSRHIGDRIEAVVTTVEMFGVFVMGLDIPAEGLIRLEGLGDDVYRFERSAKILMGRRDGNQLKIGDRLLVEVVRADPDARQIDFRLIKRLQADRPSAGLKKNPVRRVQGKKAKKKR